MELVQSTKHRRARNILRYLAEHWGRTRLIVEGFVNCREQGYHLSNYAVACSFSEDRSSDAIVVYYGNTGDFSPQGNTLRQFDASPVSRREFYTTEVDAAHAIIKFFREHPSKIEVSDDENIPFPLGAY